MLDDHAMKWVTSLHYSKTFTTNMFCFDSLFALRQDFIMFNGCTQEIVS